jgi:hypothetical protein
MFCVMEQSNSLGTFLGKSMISNFEFTYLGRYWTILYSLHTFLWQILSKSFYRCRRRYTCTERTSVTALFCMMCAKNPHTFYCLHINNTTVLLVQSHTNMLCLLFWIFEIEVNLSFEVCNFNIIKFYFQHSFNVKRWNVLCYILLFPHCEFGLHCLV